MFQKPDRTKPPTVSHYDKLEEGADSSDTLWQAQMALCIDSWAEQLYRDHVVLPMRSIGLMQIPGITTYRLTKHQLIITSYKWDRYWMCMLPKRAVAQSSRHIDLDHIISCQISGTAKPYVTYETVTIEMDMMKTQRPVENIYVNPGESAMIVAKIMALTRDLKSA